MPACQLGKKIQEVIAGQGFKKVPGHNTIAKVISNGRDNLEPKNDSKGLRHIIGDSSKEKFSSQMSNKKMLSQRAQKEILSINEGKAENNFASGLVIQESRKKIRKISTGSPSFDMLLQGGIESSSITEVFGEFRTGKTQLAMTLCVTAQLPRSQGGGQGKVIYIDTENTFRPERIHQIAKRYDLDAEEVLDNIMVARSFTVDSLQNLLMQAEGVMVANEDQYSLLIIDSIMHPFRVDYHGRGKLSERQKVMGRFLSKVQKISEQFNVAVLITNQVMADPGGAMSYTVDPKQPVGGHILAHAFSTRLFLRKGKGEQRICKIFDSPSIPESECVFQLSEGGIIDPSD